MAANSIHAATDAANLADAAWKAAYEAICPKRIWPGDFRYSAAAKGEPGSELRGLHDAFLAASAAMHQAWEARR